MATNNPINANQTLATSSSPTFNALTLTNPLTEANGGTHQSTYATGDTLYASGANTLSKLAVSTRPGSGIGTDGSVPVFLDPFQYLLMVDDFVTTASSSNYGWTQSALNSASSNFGSGVVSAHPGVVRLTTGSNIAGAVTMRMNIAASNAGTMTFGGGAISLIYVCNLNQLSSAVDSFIVRVGYGDTTNAAITTGAYFEYTHGTNSGNWQILTANGGARTTTNTTVAVATGWLRLRIDINAAGTSAAFYVNDVQCDNSPLSNNIPTTNGTGPVFMIVKTGGSTGTTACTYDFDLFYLYQKLTVSR